ncbi:type II toxin-antitoxin system RelE/ParE family toxin [Citrobacter rodentium]|jgi:hypothetical protein|nr:type II toxin-antitoxin system RelE/ParE family toxin [Citrobacter rodentium]KIQ50944.1 hypothetical protein TA05_12940 [Citrobacter rodentium]QBY31831.1 type II toxin-antitoxin system RelE/ParE family toxin [Citrobacter rodentium]UHO30815.1 type II toxin-antitoxin system RelE/ParE family toxin [Citrobacter rodentium NBRC 105723 = DSM 16636]HAT8013543.1 type II toxin-antitoxin system RelE/ParE family toxin [Citrobacter rodentium NBRC 105723 = DSM 16636]HAT8018565.1 type II toxin-antitoxin s
MNAGQEENQTQIDVYETNRFKKTVDKLPEALQEEVEDQIDIILANPQIGELKKGDLSHLRVHKFRLNGQLTLLGYTWLEDKIELYLLHVGSHENFYDEQKKHRKADLKLIG